MFLYEVYGLSIVCDTPLRYLSASLANRERSGNKTPINSKSETSISVNLSKVLPLELNQYQDWPQLYPEPSHSDTTAIQIRQHKQWVYLHCQVDKGSILKFFISSCGRKIYCEKPSNIPQSDVESFLIGPVLGYTLRLLGKTCLHASVLSYRNHAFAILGKKGAGKSTTASALLAAGSKLIADDIAVLDFNDKMIKVQAGYSAIRLLPKALKRHSLSIDDSHLVASSGKKKYVSLLDDDIKWAFDQRQLPLSCVYTLARRDTKLDTCIIEQLSQKEALLALRPHRYPSYLIGQKHKTQTFTHMAKVARKLPIKNLTCANNLSKLSSIATIILQDFGDTLSGQ